MSAVGKKRPMPLTDDPTRTKRRSISTTSRDTTAANSPTEPPIVQYAPIDTHPYHHQAAQAPMVAPTDPQLASDHDQLADISHFNNSHSQPSEHPQYPIRDGSHVENGTDHQGQDTAYRANGQHGFVQQNAPQHRPMNRTLSMSLDGAAGTGTDEEKKGRKIANNNAANEKELRELIEGNAHRSLESIARDVRNAERTQKAEKAKQLFAMRWLKQYCRRGHESVPRARVYTYYAQRCGNDRVDTLNPASFGKLVRIIFPGIQTRRLGVRGESKYHYVSLALVEDPQPSIPRPGSAQMSIGSERATPIEPDVSFQNSTRIPADSATFPQHEDTFPQPIVETSANPASQGQLFAEAPQGHPNSGTGSRPMYKQKLRFSHMNDRPFSNEDLSSKVPPILDFVPPGFDGEQPQGLSALYVAHCTSLVDAVRYVREKQFFKLIGTFNGTMTVPVSKLFQQPAITDWIKACDRVMYQQIIRFVSQLVLQVLPQQVFMMLRSIGFELCDVIRKHFHQYPPHVLNAKLETATIFTSLLQRLLRVNETAHAAANLLMKDEMRAIMWADWVNSIKPGRVVETSLSRCGHEEAYRILTADMRLLLAPLPGPGAIEEPPEFISATPVLDPDEWQDYATADTIMERWSSFLRRLPTRFPDVPTRTLLHCLESVGCAALRDITVNVAQSFGAWWTTKVWMDEMMLWLAEMGGFLDDDSAPPSPAFDDSLDAVIHHSLHDLRHHSRPATASDLPRPNSAHPNLDYSLSGLSPNIRGQRHSSGPPAPTCKTPFSSCPLSPNLFEYCGVPGMLMADQRNAVKFGMTPGKHRGSVGGDDFEDSGIGMGMLEGTGFTPFKNLSGTGFTPFRAAAGEG